ncbi:MAG: hybrid sensor histidine kinase/response regulator [Anaerolineae bacterium]
MEPDQGSVLVVDDNREIRAMLSHYLKRQGHSVTVAENGRQGLELVRAKEFDLVLLDIMMPEMNGYQMLEHLKADPVLRHIPVIMISAVDELESVVKCIELGAEDSLSKPFNPVLLKARIGASLEKKHLRDQEQAYLEELSVMQRIDRELNTTLDVNRAMGITLEWAMRRSNADAGLVGIVEENGIQIMASQGYGAELAPYQDAHLPVELPAIQQTIQSGQPQRQSTTEVQDDSQTQFTGGLFATAQSQIVVPIRREAEVIGLLLLESVAPEGFVPETLAFLTRLSDHAAIAIANAQLYAALEAANIAKSDFISFVSHELKTPMTSIKGYSDMLVQGAVGEVNEMQVKFLNIVRSNVDRMTVLVDDLTDVSRIEAGRLHLELKAVSIVDVVEEVLQSTRTQLEEKELALTQHIPDDLSLVWADRSRLIQILTNMMSNAYKYTPRGGQIAIRVEQVAKQWDPDGAPEVVHIAVQDSGIGISPKDQANIFQKFFRSEDQKARESPGTGLGLNITKNLVEMQGGRIWFESEFRQGTTFHFTVPVVETE